MIVSTSLGIRSNGRFDDVERTWVSRGERRRNARDSSPRPLDSESNTANTISLETFRTELVLDDIYDAYAHAESEVKTVLAHVARLKATTRGGARPVRLISYTP